MPDLSFEVIEAASVPFAVAPTIGFSVRVANADPEERIHTVTLRVQIQIETARRKYVADEQGRLRDLFGEPVRWAQTLKTMLWTHASAVVNGFSGAATVELSVPCTFDFNVAATKYFAALESGDVPLVLQFSGTVFYEAKTGALQVAQIPWSKEATYRLPVRVWRDMMDHYYPNSAWLCLDRAVFERLAEYKTDRGLPTWERALERLLDEAREKVEP